MKILLIGLTYSQNNLVRDPFVNTSENSLSSIYHNISGFNNTNKTRINKIKFLNIIDSTIRINVLEETKFEYFLEKDKDIILSWTKDNNIIEWEPWFYLVDHYNKDGLISKYTFNLNWSGDQNELDESDPEIFRKWHYDENLLLIRFEEQDRFDLLNENIGNLELYEYDINQNLTTFTRFLYDPIGDSLFLYLKSIYNHNERGFLQSASSYIYNNRQEAQAFDSLNILYNQNGMKVLEKDFLWRDSSFIIEQLREFDYDQFGRINEIRHRENYDSLLQRWLETDVFIYDYHSYGSLQEITQYDSSYISYGELEKVKSYFYEYDSTILFNQIKTPRSNQQNHNENHMILEEGETSYNGLIRTIYYYSPYTTSTTSTLIENLSLSVSPNPSEDFIRFDLPEDHNSNIRFKIVDVKGTVMMSDVLQTNEPLDIRGLDSGVYFYIVVGSKEGVFSGKFVKL